MKKQNKKFLTFMLAAALGVATVGGVATVNVAGADDASTYDFKDVFTTSGSATMEANATNAEKLNVTFPDGGALTLKKRDLALKWFEQSGTASYFNFGFTLEDTAFETLSIAIDSASAWATEDEKTTNTVTFTAAGGEVKVKVNDGDESAVSGTVINLALAEDVEGDYGEFAVTVNGATVGTFTNVGANFAERTSEMTPLTIKATMPEGAADDAKTTITLNELNGQSLALTEGKFVDDASPVLIVNEELNRFVLGTQYAVSTEIVDVLSTSPTTATTYYQYNPTTVDKEDRYITMPTTKPYFQETIYEEGGAKKSVYEEKGAEYFSVKVTLKDSTKANDKEVQLAWYAEDGAVEELSGVQYILVDRQSEGASYNCFTKDDSAKENVFTETDAYKDFVKAVEKAAEGLKAGSKSYFYVPSMKGLITDDNGYSNLKFTIAYKNVDGSKTSSNLSASSLKFTTAKAGLYEFRILANDKAGNTMRYYVEGVEESVTTSNIWNIENYPTFTFSVENSGLSVEDGGESDRTDTAQIGGEYTLKDVNVLGDAADGCTSTFALYKLNLSAYEVPAGGKELTKNILSGITYDKLQSKAESIGIESGKKDYIKLYQKAYAECVADALGGEVEADDVMGIFTKIEAFDSRISEKDHPTEWKKNNKYKWDADAASFTAADSGNYLILCVYGDSEIAAHKTSAYKLITAKNEDDVIVGETEWLRNNVVSVVLFSIAGVLLIILLVLLMVKPSDETLDDVTEKAKAKKDKKSAK